jgi:hypothetical protein
MRRLLLPLIIFLCFVTAALGATSPATTKSYIQSTFRSPEIEQIFLRGADESFTPGKTHFMLKSSRPSAPAAPSLKPQEKMALDSLAKRNGGPLGTLSYSFGQEYSAGYELKRGKATIQIKPAGAARGMVEDGLLVYKNVGGRMDVVMAPAPGGFEELFLIKTAGQNKEAIERKITVSGGTDIKVNSQGELEAGGFILSEPLIIDARGKKTVGKYEIKEKNKTGQETSALLALSFDAAGLTYPVLVDPTWRSSGTMPEALINQTTTVTLLPNGKVLVVGGEDAFSYLSSSTCQLYDPATGAWTTTGSLPVPKIYHTATLLPNGKVLVAGGWVTDKSCQLYDPATGTWATTGSLNTGRSKHTATLLSNGKVLVAGGQGVPYLTNTCEVYDPATGTWTATGNLGAGRFNHQAALLPNGKVLVAGGHIVWGPYSQDAANLSSCELYDPATGTWSGTGSLHYVGVTPGHPLYFTASLTATSLLDGKVLMLEGGSFVPTSGELYDPATGTWTATGGLNVARCAHAATLLPNGKVLVAGGYGTNGPWGPLTSCELYDPASGAWTLTGDLTSAAPNFSGLQSTLLPNGQVIIVGETGGVSEVFDPAPGSWTTTGNMADAVCGHTATLLPDGKVLIAGGGEQIWVADTCQLYDPATGLFSVTGSMNEARYFHSATLLANGQVLVVGAGYAYAGELYYPATGTWEALSNFVITDRRMHSATLLPNGQVLIAGGQTGSTLITYSSCEVYYPTIKAAVATAGMGTARWGHTATLLPNGKVLAAGGVNSGGVLRSCELYDPAAGTWTPTGNLNIARGIGTATLLPNGKVLYAGGSGGACLASCELYDPATGQWTMTGSLRGARGSHSATLLPNGKVMATAGESNIVPIKTCEIYDPATGTWSPMGNLSTERRYSSATLLTSGNVLVAGGEENRYVGNAYRVSGTCDLVRYTEYDCTAYPDLQPVITAVGGTSSFPVILYRNAYYTITGSNLKGITDYPRVYLQFAESTGGYYNGGSSRLLDLSATTCQMSPAQWQAADNTISFTVPGDLPSGYYLLTVRANGVPSNAKMVYCNGAVTPPTNSITSSTDPHGFITPSGTTTVNYGTSQSYTITAEAGYYVLDVLVDGVSVGTTNYYTFTGVTVGHTIHAVVVAGDAFTVVNCNDSGPGSLRQCILNANAHPGRDTITFNIPDTDPGFIWGYIVQPRRDNIGFWEISPQSPLPDITESVAILGSTQSDNQGNSNPYGPAVEIGGDGGFYGSHLSNWAGFQVRGANNCTIEGLTINNSGLYDGIYLTYGDNMALITGCNIHDNYIGTDPSGTYSLGYTNTGIRINGGTGNRLANNLAAGTPNEGICIEVGSGNIVVGNILGLNQPLIGEVNLANQEGLVIISGGHNIIGGDTPAEANVIAGNVQAGIWLTYSDDNQIKGNYIGTDATGVVGTYGNSGYGIFVSGNNNRIGPNNVIAYNLLSGVVIFGDHGNTITQNSIFGQGAQFDIRLVDNANDNILPPLILSATLTGVSGEARPGSTVEVFATGPSENDNGGWTSAAGAGGGRVYLGSATADGNGRWSKPLSLTNGRRLTATATDPNGNTSQFAQNIDVGAAGRTFVVITTADSGEGSLRQCMNYANQLPGHDQIVFNIPMSLASDESGVTFWPITPAGSLPEITDSVTILGSTQGVNQGNTNSNRPVVMLDGKASAYDADGLIIRADGCSIEGLDIDNWATGLVIFSDGNHIYNNNFGGLSDSMTGHLLSGVAMTMSSHNVIGGPTLAERNNFWTNGCAIYLQIESSYNRIQGNYMRARHHPFWFDHHVDGLDVYGGSNYNQIGGSSPGEGNIIYAGYGGYGIDCWWDGCFNQIKGNQILSEGPGKEAAGGILLDTSNNNQIGGTAAGEGNTIAFGIQIAGTIGSSSSNEIQGNNIGVDVGGTNLENPFDGVNVASSTGPTTIGPFNHIAYNGGAGVAVASDADHVTITRNTMEANGDFGIKLIGGANDGAASWTPVIDSAILTGLTGTSAYNAIVEVFATDVPPDPSGAGQGKTYLGSATADDDGGWALTIPLTKGATLTATGTDPNGNTSQFSMNVQVSSTFEVTNTNDDGPNSLRQIITYANLTPGLNIIFNIPASDPGYVTENGVSFWKIQTLSPLPYITRKGLVIDGTTQTVNKGDTNTSGPEINIDGTLAGPDTAGLNIFAADNCVVRGLVINHFSKGGINLNSANYTTVEGCSLGITPDGGTAAGSGYEGDAGVKLTNSSHNMIGDGTLAGRNIISGFPGAGNYMTGNWGVGVWLESGSSYNNILGNYIGTDRTGLLPLGNGGQGIEIGGGSQYNRIGDGTAGGRNVVSGNGGAGIDLESAGNYVLGNYVGVDATGNSVMPNETGIFVNFGYYNLIGDGTEGGRNIVCGNYFDGIEIFYNGSGNRVLGNYIGLNAAGAPAGNGNHGVDLHSSGTDSDVKFNTISLNRIYDNGGLGINLAGDVNQGIAAPTIEAAFATSIAGVAPAGSTVEVFATGIPDYFGAGEGLNFIGSVIANSGGQWSLPLTLTENTTLSATATDRQGNTSMFAVNFLANPMLIPLSITREADTVGSDVVISWAGTDVPDVYVLTGDGGGICTGVYSGYAIGYIGVYTNEAAAWTKVTNPVAAGFSLSGSSLHHIDQVGTGFGEAYYKALKAGTSKDDNLPSAEAVGKHNLHLNGGGYNLISLPLVPQDRSISGANTLGHQLDGLSPKVYWLDPLAGNNPVAYQLISGQWLGGLTMIKEDAAYEVYCSSEATITVVGSVSPTARAVQIVGSNKTNYVGNTFPLPATLAKSGLKSIFGPSDTIHSVIQGGPKVGTFLNNNWGGSLNQYGLIPGLGYQVLKLSGGNPVWGYPKPY